MLSTPDDPSKGVLDGLRMIARAKGKDVESFAREVSTIVHGTTVTTNAVLTRNGALTGLITTAGVRDALEMRRGIREEQYNNHYTNVRPLVERSLRIGVKGRALDRAGNELVPLRPRRGDATLPRALKEAGVDAVAICFMNAFKRTAPRAGRRRAHRERSCPTHT